MDYTHATAEHHRVFLSGRITALEQEHYALALLIEGMPDDDPLRSSYAAQLAATERNIESLRAGLAKLDHPSSQPAAPVAIVGPTRTGKTTAPRKRTTKRR